MTRHLIHQLWHFPQWLGQPLAYRGCHSAICQGAMPNMPQLADFGGFFFCDGRYMPTVAQTIAGSAKNRQWIRCRSKIRRIWRTGFYIYGWTIVHTVALRWAIFKQKKGSVAICLGLIYCSMGSSQPPTRDTVPLILIPIFDF
jgi:hypothetical protein